MLLSHKLKLLRKRKGITQEQLANAIDVTISTIRNYEMEKSPRKPTPVIYNRLADFFDVPVEYLLYDDIENTTKENIDIQKELGLNDKTIALIKFVKDFPINSISMLETLNEFFSEINMLQFLMDLVKLKSIYSTNKYIKELISMEYSDIEEEKLLEIIEKYEEEQCIWIGNGKPYTGKLKKILKIEDALKRELKCSGFITKVINTHIEALKLTKLDIYETIEKYMEKSNIDKFDIVEFYEKYRHELYMEEVVSKTQKSERNSENGNTRSSKK